MAKCLVCETPLEEGEELCGFCRDAVDAYWQEESENEEFLASFSEEFRRLVTADTTGLAETVSVWLAENE